MQRRSAQGMVELIAWCHFNDLLVPTTRFIVMSSGVECTSRDAEALANHLYRRFPKHLDKCATVESLAKAATLVVAGMFTNFVARRGSDGLGGDTVVTSDRTDALSYSAWHPNLV